VASNVGGLPEVIEHGVCGWLSDLGDIDSMIEGALHILKDEERHNTFSMNARRRAQEHFSAEILVRQYEAIYEKLMHSTRE